MQYGILLVAFGTNTTHGKISLSFFEEQVKSRFPGIPIYWAFTSKRIRYYFSCEGEKIESVEDTLINMASNGFTHIAVQPLHVVSGIEYTEIVSVVHFLRRDPAFPVVLIGKPLLTENINIVSRAVDAIFSCIPEERKIDEPVLFMGHGSRRLPEDKYMSLSNTVAVRDPLVFIGTMNGVYRLEHILPVLKCSKNQVWLLPLLALIGNHALEDMAGPNHDSWKSRLEDNGFTCVPILKGMIEYPAFIQIWIEHLASSLDVLYSSSCLPIKNDG